MQLKFNQTDWELPADESKMGFYVKAKESSLNAQTAENDNDSATQIDLGRLPARLKIIDNKVE